MSEYLLLVPLTLGMISGLAVFGAAVPGSPRPRLIAAAVAAALAALAVWSPEPMYRALFAGAILGGAILQVDAWAGRLLNGE